MLFNKLLNAINEGVNNALMKFDDEKEPILKKSNEVGEIYKKWIWIENNTVDLGLPSGTRWAKCNIGAECPTDYGMYFLWGDPTGYIDGFDKFFSSSNYKWFDRSKNLYVKYNDVDQRFELDVEDDPAYIHSDGKLISPSRELCKELYDYCDWSWTTIKGVKGCKVLGKANDNYIFLPASGLCAGPTIISRGSHGYYWSRSLNPYIVHGNGIHFNSSDIDPLLGNGRSSGFSIRAVLI